MKCLSTYGLGLFVLVSSASLFTTRVYAQPTGNSTDAIEDEQRRQDNRDRLYKEFEPKYVAPTEEPPEEKNRDLAFDLSFGTLFPMAVSAQGLFEIMETYQVSLDIGYMPQPYVLLMNDVVQQYAGYNDKTKELINNGIQNSFFLRLSGGVKVWKGLEIFGGYTAMALGGSVSTWDTVEAALGRSFDRTGLPDVNAPMKSQLHGFHLGVGYQMFLVENLFLRLQATYFQVLTSKTTVDLSTRNIDGQRTINEASAALDQYLNDIYTRYVKLPVIGAFIGFRFD